MMNTDVKSKEQIRNEMKQALEANNVQAFGDAMNEMIETVGAEVSQKYEAKIAEMKAETDKGVLTARGARQLTSEEKQYYQRLGDAMKAADPKQALVDANLVMPETVIAAVFDELQTEHPLLSRIDFIPTGGAVKMLLNTNGYQQAAWGKLCDEIIKELTGGFKAVDTTLLKLSAFIPVCKATLELGAEWLDSFIRQTLYEAIANGLEYGILKGDGNESPIGMVRDVSEGVSVVGGVYPEKAKVKLNDLQKETVGNLIAMLAIDGNGKPREVRDLVLVVNPQDYFQKVMPATTLATPIGGYANDVLPYPISIVQSAALSRGEAVLGIGYKYFAAVGMDRSGRIEYSDHYRFLEDERVYLAKLYANGFPMDNNAFLYLDISDLQPMVYKVETVTHSTVDGSAKLASLSFGAARLTPAFDPDTTTYTLTTANASNVVNALPEDAGATVTIATLNSEGDSVEIGNGAAVEWDNVSSVVVTVKNGDAETVYTVSKA